MRLYDVTVRTETTKYKYTALAATSADVIDDALQRFGVCAIFVRSL